MLCIVSFSSTCAEQLLVNVLEDDRFLRKADLLHDMMVDALGKIAITGDAVWHRLAVLVGMDAIELQHCTIHVAATTVAFISRDVFGDIRKEPLSLTQGNIEEHVRALSIRVGVISDPTTRQLRSLLDHGEPQAHLVDCLK